MKTLFLDRDGVINQRIVGDYVKNWHEFVFLDKVLDALKLLSKHFDYIFIVTNQQGIGKGLMTEEDLAIVHNKMVQVIREQGGIIHAVYHAPKLAHLNSEDRKPGPGMALRAQKAFPEVNFGQATMVGDSPSDIDFGYRLGMNTVFIQTREDLNEEEKAYVQEHAQIKVKSLYEFALRHKDSAKNQHLNDI